MRRRLEEPAGVPIGLPADQPAGIVQLEWCSAFTGPARAALHALKYDGELRLVEPLAELMSERWRRASRRWRAARARAGPCRAAAPARLRPGRASGARLLAQAGLAGRACARSAPNARRLSISSGVARGRATSATPSRFPRRCASHVRGRWVIVVDDIVTTGATLAGCARVLYEAGAEAVSALALARER